MVRINVRSLAEIVVLRRERRAIGGAEGGDTYPFGQQCSPAARPPHHRGYCSTCRAPITWASRLASPCHCPFSAVASRTPLRRPLSASASAFLQGRHGHGRANSRAADGRSGRLQQETRDAHGWTLALAGQHGAAEGRGISKREAVPCRARPTDEHRGLRSLNLFSSAARCHPNNGREIT